MSISNTVKHFLDEQSINYELVSHVHTHSSMETAGAAHVASNQVAKAVIIKEADDYAMVIVPCDYHIHLGRLHHFLGHEVGLATEQELVSLFPDCEGGAIPPLGMAYHLKTFIDKSLLDRPVIFFESGDHENLVKLTGEQFRHLFADAEHVNVGKHH